MLKLLPVCVGCAASLQIRDVYLLLADGSPAIRSAAAELAGQMLRDAADELLKQQQEEAGAGPGRHSHNSMGFWKQSGSEQLLCVVGYSHLRCARHITTLVVTACHWHSKVRRSMGVPWRTGNVHAHSHDFFPHHLHHTAPMFIAVIWVNSCCLGCRGIMGLNV